MTENNSILLRRERGRITLQDIAEKLSVSTATVSLALRDAPVVADATRRKVQKLARELGYVYNRSAASLRTARSNLMAVGFHDITNPSFSEMLTAIEETALNNGRTVLLGTYADDIDRQDRALSLMREYRPDGMILCAARGATAASFDHLIAAGIPIVQIAREIEEIGLDFVGADDAKGVSMAVGHLYDLGHRRIAMVGGTSEVSTGRNRKRAYRETLERLGLPYDPDLDVVGESKRDFGIAAVDKLLAIAPAPTAAICACDQTAFGVLIGLHRRGIAIGQDFSVVGSDDVQEAATSFPALTTIRTHTGEMGRIATKLLLERIGKPAAEPTRIILDPELVIRNTSGVPRS